MIFFGTRASRLLSPTKHVAQYFQWDNHLICFDTPVESRSYYGIARFVRPSVNILLSTGISTCCINFNKSPLTYGGAHAILASRRGGNNGAQNSPHFRQAMCFIPKAGSECIKLTTFDMILNDHFHVIFKTSPLDKITTISQRIF